MKAKEQIFKALKEKYQVALRPSWFFSGQHLSIPQGGVVEVVGSARYELAIQFVSEQPDLSVAWVEPEWTLFPPAVAQRGVDVTRWLLVEAGEQALWAVEELLNSHFFSVIFAPDLRLSLPQWRRLQLQCERAGSTLFILSEKPHQQVGALFLLEAQWRQGQLRSQWQKCRQVL